MLSLILFFTPADHAHGDALSDAMVVAIGTANTQVSEAEAAATSVQTLATTATTEANQAIAASNTLTSDLNSATAAVNAVDNSIIIITNATGIDQSSQTVSNAKDTITNAQSKIDAISTVLASSELAQANTAKTAATTAMATSLTEFSQANAAISNAQDAINALQASIATVRDVLQNVDDAGVQLILPFNMQMGGVVYNSIYVGSNATLTFGTNEGWVYYTTPNAASVSVGGLDWTTWSYGSGITYATTGTTLDIAWDVRVYPTRDSSVQLTQLRFNADVNPTTGAWVATVSGIGPMVDQARWNYRQIAGGTIVQIQDTSDPSLVNTFSGILNQGNYVAPAVDPNANNAIIQAQIDAANSQLSNLNQRISAVVILNSANQNAINSIPSTSGIQSNINNAITGKANLNSLLSIKSTQLTDTINQNIPTPAPVIDGIIFADGKVTVSMSMPAGYTSNTWFYRISTTDPNAANPYANETRNTDGSPSSFEISGLTEGATYTISVANWSGPTSTFTDYTLSIPAPQTASLNTGGGYPVDTTPQTPPDETTQSEDSGTINEDSSNQDNSSTNSTDTSSQPTDTTPIQDIQPSVNPTPSVPSSSNNSTPGMIENNPNSLPTDIPKEAPKEVLVPHIQVDKAGVENGGIEFFGTQTQPQVVGEDGKLTPPPPPPGSGQPIPADAITITETFIGQPGGTTFNAPDVAVPVLMSWVCHTVIKDDGSKVHLDIDGNEHPIERCTFLPAALNAIPGAGQAIQAVGALYTSMANIGNDMSPVTRKKAKKILVATVIVVPIVRRRFGN